MKNKYQVVKTIGKGGFGQVKLVKRKSDGKQFIRKETAFDKTVPDYNPEKAKAFLDYQIKILNQLKKKKICSKFICPIESYEQKHQTYIIMDYLSGYKDLSDPNLKLKLDTKKKREICNSLIDGVLDLHNNDIVHVDIKLANAMIHPKTHDVRIIDFGGAIVKNPQKKKYKVINFSEDYTFLDLKNKMYSFDMLKKNDMLALGMMLIDFIANANDGCGNLSVKGKCTVDPDYYETYEKCKNNTKNFEKKNIFDVYQLILNEYLQTTEFKFFSTEVYNKRSKRFLEMNKEELNMLKMMIPS